MDVSNHLGPRVLATDVRVKVTWLPELLPITSQFARSGLLERLEKLRQENGWWLVDQQVKMFRHQHVCVNPGLMTRPCLFQNRFDRFLGLRVLQGTEAGESN